MATKLNDYVDDDLIVTAMLFAGIPADEVRRRIEQNRGNARAAFDDLKGPTADDRSRKRHGLIKDYLDHLGTGNLEKLMREGAGLDENDVKTAIYWAQRETGGVATPTLDRVLYHLGGITGRTKTQRAIDFAATIRPGLQAVGRADTGLMTTRTQYKQGRPPAPPPPGPGLGAPPPPGGAPALPGDVRQVENRNITSGRGATGSWGPGAGGAGAGGAGAPGTATAIPAAGADRPTDPFPTDPGKVRDWLTRNAPEWAYLLDIPEVAAIVRDPNVWDEGADTSDLLGRLMQTQWWQKTEPAARQWLDLKHRDPASAGDQIVKKTTELKQQAQALGVTIPEDQWARLAEDSLKFDWDDNEIRSNLTNYFVFDQNRLTGAAQAARAHIEQAARDWLVPMDDKTMENWVTQIVKGTATTDYFDTYLANQARSLFPQLTDAIDRGVAPAQYMAPYATIAAQELNLNPEDIDLRDPKWMRAVHQVDDKGGRRPMTLYDWRNLVRTDESYGWDKTQAGRDHGASLARNIAAQFGFASGGGL